MICKIVLLLKTQHNDICLPISTLLMLLVLSRNGNEDLTLELLPWLPIPHYSEESKGICDGGRELYQYDAEFNRSKLDSFCLQSSKLLSANAIRHLHSVAQ